MLVVLILTSACGIDFKIKESLPRKIETFVGPDFEKAALFCDNRYGYKTLESEKCFKDYRNFLQVKVGVDADAVANYCSDRFPNDQQALDQCEDDINDLIIGEQGGQPTTTP